MMHSKSSIETWHFCPRKWKYAYIDQREPRADYLTPEARNGIAGHSVLERLHTGQDSPPPEGKAFALLGLVLDAYRKTQEIVPFDGAEVSWNFASYFGAFDGLSGNDIWEHKFTTKDVGNDTTYWDKLDTDWQVGLYQLAARRSLGLSAARIVYNVVRIPQYRRRQGEDESEFYERYHGYLLDNPQNYFFRRYVRWDDEALASLEQDLADTVKEIDLARVYPKNRSNCFAWRRRCEYYEACHAGVDLADDTVYKIRMRGRQSG